MISIIIPFNCGKKYLERCLNNILEIEYKNFEIILIDDYSQDNSEKIAKKYMKKANIKYYYTDEKTIGVGNARNLGIEKAQGKYIMFVDIDDIIDRKILKKLEKYMSREIDMIKYKMKIIKGDKENLVKGSTFEETDGQDGFNKLCYNDRFLDSPCVYLIKKELFNRTGLKFEKNVYHEDFGLIPQLIVNSESIVSTNNYGYYYFQSNNSIMRDNNYSKEIKKVNDKFIHYDNLMKNIEKFNLKSQTKENLLSYYTNSLIMAIKKLKKQERIEFEEMLKKKKIIENIKPKNIKQYIKKIIIKNNIELYYKLS